MISLQKTTYRQEVFLTLAWCLFMLLRLSPGIGTKDPLDYDEGVFLCTARELLAGKELYSEIFSTQPPLFSYLLKLVFSVDPSHIMHARLFILLLSLVALFSFSLAARSLIGNGAGIISAILVSASPLFCHQAITLQPGTVSLAFGMIALGCALSAPTLSGALLGLSFSTKLSGALFALPLYLLARTPSLLAGAAVVTIFILIPHLGPPFREQVFQFHLSPLILNEQHSLFSLCTAFAVDHAPLLLLMIGIRKAPSKRTTLFLVSLFLFNALFLATHSPVHAHHFLPLLIPIALTGTLVVSTLPPRIQAATLGALLALSSGIGTPKPHTPGHAEDLRRVLRKYTDQQFAGDAQYYVFQTGHRSPPWLCDTSATRIRRGKLSAADMIEHSKSSNGVIFWSKRMELLPEYGEWAKRHFPNTLQLDKRKKIFREHQSASEN